MSTKRARPKPGAGRRRITLERTFRATPEEVWELWTTQDGIESWWGPEGFRVEVMALDLRVGGDMDYAMIATGPEQVAFMKRAGMPVRTEHRVTFTEVVPLRRLAYVSLADFIPGVEPYEVAMEVELHARGDSVRLVMTFDTMHDKVWSDRKRMGWEQELGKLDRAIQARPRKRTTIQKIQPALWFDGEAEKAARFYTSIFKDSKILNVARFTEGSMGKPGSVMTVNFQLEGQPFLAINGGPHYTFTPAISLMVRCADQREVDELWRKLGRGGEPGQCGWLTDKFGVTWQVIPEGLDALLQDPDPERCKRATQAMLKMRKLDLAAMRKAADGAGPKGIARSRGRAAASRR